IHKPSSITVRRSTLSQTTTKPCSKCRCCSKKPVMPRARASSNGAQRVPPTTWLNREPLIMNDQPSTLNQTPPVVAEFHPAERDDGEAPTQVYDCWNTIGVAGNGSCQELLRFVHCRNCPVYSAAAMQLLDRPVTADYRREWSAHYAEQKKLATPAKTPVVLFRIASEWLLLPTQALQEVAERRAMHSLPHRRRDLVLGLVNVRGELLVCVSLGRWLGLAGLVTSDEWRVARAAGALPANRRSSPGPDRLLVANWGGNR